MKKRLILPAFAAAIIIGALVFIYPLSFSKIVADDSELIIVIVEKGDKPVYPNGQVNESTREYRFNPEAEAFMQIRQILSNHSYHRSLRTFQSDNSLLINDRYYLNLYSGKNLIATGGTNEIRVNYRIHNIGYFGYGAAFSMMDEIKSVLDLCEPFWENNSGSFPSSNTDMR